MQTTKLKLQIYLYAHIIFHGSLLHLLPTSIDSFAAVEFSYSPIRYHGALYVSTFPSP